VDNALDLHWTKGEISYVSNCSTDDLSYTYQAQDRGEFPQIRKFGSTLCPIRMCMKHHLHCK